jgi:NAD(P)-dependent dehydrogenase (short-subunit alcohol dehydrogenase family)
MNKKKSYSKQTMKPNAILITGAGQRIGLALVNRCISLGYTVIAHTRTADKELHDLVKNEPSLCTKLIILRSELTTNPEELINAAKQLPITLIGLINNAAIFTKGTILSNKLFFDMLNINTFVPYRLSVAFSKIIKKGWIINITDAHASSLNKTYQNYRISKIMLTELTRQLAFSLAPNIRVNAIAPGAIIPAANKTDQDFFKKLPSIIPLGKTGSTADVTLAMEYLINAQYVTGQTLYADGGWHLKD